jgi:hypothetical protein
LRVQPIPKAAGEHKAKGGSGRAIRAAIKKYSEFLRSWPIWEVVPRRSRPRSSRGVTEPSVTPRVRSVAGRRYFFPFLLNVALTFVLAWMVSVQAPVPLHPPPLQPLNTELRAAVAVSVTLLLSA